MSTTNMESQLLSIMHVLVKSAVAEIIQLFAESTDSLRLHLTQSLKENESLRVRTKVMRSELFSLRMQTRTNRPVCRALTPRAPKLRSKPQVLKPPVGEEPIEEVAAVVVKSESPVTKESADGDAPDVILIKDEEDVVEGCDDVVGEDNIEENSASEVLATGAPSVDLAHTSCASDSKDDLRIVSVYSGVGESLLQQRDALLSESELQVFGSMTDDINPDGLLTFATGMKNLPPSEKTHSPQRPASDSSSQIGTTSQFSQQPAVFVKEPADCSFCGKWFLTREELTKHRALHTGESHIRCSMCGKPFVNKATLNIHMRIHTGEKPYACQLCGKRFTQNGSLKIHLRTHSGEKPYTCNQCPASFNNPSNLRRHMITHS